MMLAPLVLLQLPQATLVVLPPTELLVDPMVPPPLVLVLPGELGVVVVGGTTLGVPLLPLVGLLAGGVCVKAARVPRVLPVVVVPPRFKPSPVKDEVVDLELVTPVPLDPTVAVRLLV